MTTPSGRFFKEYFILEFQKCITGTIRETRIGRNQQNVRNKERGLKTAVETNTLSTNNIFYVIFQFFYVQQYLLEAVQKVANEYIPSTPAVAPWLDMLFYVRQYLGLQETSPHCFGIGGSMGFHCQKQQDQMYCLGLQLPTYIAEAGIKPTVKNNRMQKQ